MDTGKWRRKIIRMDNSILCLLNVRSTVTEFSEFRIYFLSRSTSLSSCPCNCPVDFWCPQWGLISVSKNWNDLASPLCKLWWLEEEWWMTSDLAFVSWLAISKVIDRLWSSSKLKVALRHDARTKKFMGQCVWFIWRDSETQTWSVVRGTWDGYTLNFEMKKYTLLGGCKGITATHNYAPVLSGWESVKTIQEE